MNFEKTQSLYPERASSIVDPAVARLLDIENGRIKTLELSEKEKLALLTFENGLGESLEKALEIKTISSTFSTEYLLTKKGADDFKDIFKLDISEETSETIERFLYYHRGDLLDADPKKRSAFLGKAEMFADEKLLADFLSDMTMDGTINSLDKKISPQTSLLLNPEKVMKKLTLLRNFKREISSEIDSLEKSTADEALESAKSKVLELYKRKVNQCLADSFSNGAILKNMAETIGLDNLSPEEKTILTLFKGLSAPEKNYSRYDKFVHGASTAHDASGNRNQVPQELVAFAEKINMEYAENELNKERLIREKGLDPKKIFEKNISCEEFSAMEESLLEHYGSLSQYPASDYDPDGSGPAPDNKWQFIARPEFKSMSVDGSRKNIKAPSTDQSIHTIIAVLCGHETEGHFLQNINREKIPLKLINSRHLGSDRTEIFAEGGAMLVQDIVSQEAFGFRTIPHSSYIRAMLKKLDGGNYAECVKAFYDDQRSILVKKREQGELDDASFQKELSSLLKLAINRSKRLFRPGTDKNLSSRLLTKSKDTVYLEQLLLLDRLRQQGMEKYAFIGRVNLHVLADLAEIGLIDLSQIQKPELFSVELWSHVEEKYRLAIEKNPTSPSLDK